MAQKQTRDTYRGVAIIMNIGIVGVEDWREWERKELSPLDANCAFKIVYDVSEGTDGKGARHDIAVEVSHRELKGKMLDYYKHEDGSAPTQMDVTIRSLVQQGLLKKGAVESDITDAADDSLTGRTVNIRAYEELGNDGATWWPRCTFASKVVRLTGADKAARIAAFLAGKPAPMPTAKSVPVPARAPDPLPAPSDNPDDLPF